MSLNFNDPNPENGLDKKSQEIGTKLSVKPKKKGWLRRHKKLVIWLIVGILVVGGIAGAAIGGKKGPEYVTAIVQKGELKQSVEVTGKIESAESIDLNFKIIGRISNILVKAGDEVTAGQQLAILEAGALASSIADARARLAQAQADYDKVLAGASSYDILVSENTVNEKYQSLLAAQNDLDNLKLQRDTDLQNLKDTAITTLKNEIVTAEGAMDEIENTLEDSDAQGTLSVISPTLLSTAEINQIAAEVMVFASRDLINVINTNSADAEILAALEDLKSTLSVVASNLVDIMSVLNATLTSSDLSEAELDALKSNIRTEQTLVNTAQTNLQTVKSNWTNDIVYYADQITTGEDTVKKAQATLDTAAAQLDLKKSPPRQFEIDLARARVQSAQAALSLAAANYGDAVITAPVDGTITKKNYNIGEQSSIAEPILEMIGNTNFQIEVDIPESDIAKIEMNQPVTITLDAFTDDDEFAGTVTFVDPAETIISEVVYYKVKVNFNELQDNIKSGMTANVTICTDRRDDVLFVPARAVRSDNGDKYVDVIAGRKGNKVEVEQRTVTTGMRGDEGIEITSGLSEGDEVVTFVKE